MSYSNQCLHAEMGKGNAQRLASRNKRLSLVLPRSACWLDFIVDCAIAQRYMSRPLPSLAAGRSLSSSEDFTDVSHGIAGGLGAIILALIRRATSSRLIVFMSLIGMHVVSTSYSLQIRALFFLQEKEYYILL